MRMRYRKDATRALRSGVRCTDRALCHRCRSDRSILRSNISPEVITTDPRAISVVDLFSGCGGMTIGLAEAARMSRTAIRVALAADSDEHVLDIFKQNFPDANAQVHDISELFDGRIGLVPTCREKAVQEQVGRVNVLVGGPPCQGHSDLNNYTRRDDPKNSLYLRMARAAEVLRPDVVVIENVPPVQHDKSNVVALTAHALSDAGYRVSGGALDLGMLGVPQRRRRYLLLASRVTSLDPRGLLDSIMGASHGHSYRSVRWAIEDLLNLSSRTTYDTASKAKPQNMRRIDYLFDNDLYDLPNEERPACHSDGKHSYVSIYGRLHWDQPAQTITTGFGCMGQGRYVHPLERRTLTPHEAARLQTFPDWFTFNTEKRGVLAKAIGNAVPPLLTQRLGTFLLTAGAILGAD
jgi:DNA (cytosine-5)-methyltransferase 1